MPTEIELSVVMPCLNEGETLGTCIEKAIRALKDHKIDGEIIVAANASTDGSQAIATRLGATVVNVAASSQMTIGRRLTTGCQ